MQDVKASIWQQDEIMLVLRDKRPPKESGRPFEQQFNSKGKGKNKHREQPLPGLPALANVPNSQPKLAFVRETTDGVKFCTPYNERGCRREGCPFKHACDAKLKGSGAPCGGSHTRRNHDEKKHGAVQTYS